MPRSLHVNIFPTALISQLPESYSKLSSLCRFSALSVVVSAVLFIVLAAAAMSEEVCGLRAQLKEQEKEIAALKSRLAQLEKV